MDFLSIFQDMQQRMQEVKEKLAGMQVEEQAGDGMVRVVVSGAREIVNIELRKELLDNSDKEELEDLLTVFAPLTAKERCSQFPLEPQRAEIIVAGAVALIETMGALRADVINVSEGGNREGLLAEHMQTR